MQKNYNIKLNKKILYSVSAIILIISQFSCTRFNENSLLKKSTEKVNVYFIKAPGKDDITLIPTSRRISNNDSTIDATLNELFLGPTKKELLKGLMTEIPEGTRLLNSQVSADDITIDLSSQFTTGSGSASVQLKYLQLYKTLIDIAPNKNIYLNVDGKPLKTIGGEGLEVNQPMKEIVDYTKKYNKTDNLKP